MKIEIPTGALGNVGTKVRSVEIESGDHFFLNHLTPKSKSFLNSMGAEVTELDDRKIFGILLFYICELTRILRVPTAFQTTN